MKKAYFIGIAGTIMAPLAKVFLDLGWEVSGSDQEKIYPPVSTYLDENKIKYYKGYSEQNINTPFDLVIAGRSALMADKNNPEYLKAKNLVDKVFSYPEILRDYLIKENSIVVTGTFGKSTTTALISWILINAGLNPSYAFGGEPINFSDGTKITVSKYSVVEGDETPALGENDPPKFMYYKPKYLLLTATQFDHPEVYKTKEGYINAYIKLVEMLPKDGVLFYDPKKVDKKVINAGQCQKMEFLTDFETKINERFKESGLRAITLCNFLGIDPLIIKDSVLSFKGLKGRLEFLGEYGERLLYYDLSQHPSKVSLALNAIKNQNNKGRVFVVFNPSATSLKYKDGLSGYFDAFSGVDKVYIAKVNYLSSVSGENRVKGTDLMEAFGGSNRIIYEPIEEKIIARLKKDTKTDDIIIFMSSGGLDFIKLIDKVKQNFGGLNGQPI